jgi:hypothetical protein
MKNRFRIFSAGFFTVIYCFAVFAVSKSVSPPDFNKHSDSTEKVISHLSAKLFTHTPYAESSVNSFNNLPAPGFKNSFTELLAGYFHLEIRIKAFYLQYKKYANCILSYNRKSDLIFPFHYFW